MGKKHRSRGATQKARKRHYLKIKQRETRAKVYAENYYKQQAKLINGLKPVAAAAKRLSERAAQAARDLQSAAHTEEGGE